MPPPTSVSASGGHQQQRHHQQHPVAIRSRLEALYRRMLYPQLSKMLEWERRYNEAAAQCYHAKKLINDLEDLGKLRRVRISLVDDDGDEDEADDDNVAVAADDDAARMRTGRDTAKSRCSGNSNTKKTNDSTTTSNKNHTDILVHDAHCPDPTPLQLLVDVSAITGATAVPAATAENDKARTTGRDGEDDGRSAKGTAAATSSSSNATSNSSHDETTTPATGATPESTLTAGNHFYLTARIPDPTTMVLNIGCGILLPVTLTEAHDEVLPRMEAHYKREAAKWQEAASRARMNMRWVGEAHRRLGQPL